jgi:hypothetical protein
MKLQHSNAIAEQKDPSQRIPVTAEMGGQPIAVVLGPFMNLVK